MSDTQEKAPNKSGIDFGQVLAVLYAIVTLFVSGLVWAGLGFVFAALTFVGMVLLGVVLFFRTVEGIINLTDEFSSSNSN